MTDLLAIGSSSVRNSQMALSVVSNNIANVDTDGYVRQDLNLQQGLPTKNGLFFLGSGAIADGVRRAYDGQVESSLRISISDMNAQTPLIDNTERLINVFGNKNASLTPALGSFFDSLRAMSVDASSEVLRNQVISDGQTLAARFNGLATQLDELDLETKRMADDKVKTLNALAGQLASINANLQKASDIAKQPANLLDSRDQVLRDMAQITRISVSESPNGTATVSIGKNSGGTVVVDALESIPVGISYTTDTPSSSVVQLNPYENPTNLSGLIGGELGGILAFRDQMLAPAMTKLDDIASKFIDEINNAHVKGMDLNEKAGKALFSSAPDFSIDYSMAKSDVTASINVAEESPANLLPLTLTYDAINTSWIAQDTTSGARVASTGNPAQIAINGLTITMTGAARSGDVIDLVGKQRPSRTIALAITDPKALAAGDLFRVSKDVTNTGEADASIRLLEQSVTSSVVPALENVLVNNINADAALAVSPSYSLAKMVVPTGTSNLQLTMSKSANSDAELQVFTRNGRHLFGSALTSAQRSVMLSEQNGFVSGSTYSDTYLNGAVAYKNENLSLGAQAQSVITINDDGSNVIAAEAVLRGAALPALTNTGQTTMTVIAAGALKLDGSSLPALELAAGDSLTSTAVVSWLNTAINAANLPLSTSAVNEIRIPANQISTASSSLTINSVNIHTSTAITSMTALVNGINAQSASTKVEAKIDFDGSLVLSNAQGYESQTISLGSGSNVFTSLTGDIQAGIHITATRSNADTSDRTVDLSLSETGAASDLAKLGYATTLHVPSTLTEDLVVFTSGSLGNTAVLSAKFEQTQADPLQLRESSLKIVFTSDTQYQIEDVQTNTILAERAFVAGQPIQYQNLQVSLDGAPKSGDVFTIDNNSEGFGSNDNLLRLIDIESSKVLGNNDTLHESYLGLLNQAGSTARQASVTQEALQVVYDQANEARDKVAGVNLDEEAANLIRFQQSYQASARLIQTANQLFDSILRL